MGRPREFDLEQVLDIIMNVFWEKGYEGTSILDLVAATGLKKGSLYSAFADKRGMYLAALAYYDQSRVSVAVEHLKPKPDEGVSEPIGRFLGLIRLAVVDQRDMRGCFLCNASIDRAPMDEKISQLVQEGQNRLKNALCAALARSPRYQSAETREIVAMYLLATYFGMWVLAKSGTPQAVLEQMRAAALEGLEPVDLGDIHNSPTDKPPLLN